jgi:hypothetical protein
MRERENYKVERKITRTENTSKRGYFVPKRAQERLYLIHKEELSTEVFANL